MGLKLWNSAKLIANADPLQCDENKKAITDPLYACAPKTEFGK